MKLWYAIKRRFSRKAKRRRTNLNLVIQHRPARDAPRPRLCPTCGTPHPCAEFRRLTGSVTPDTPRQPGV